MPPAGGCEDGKDALDVALGFPQQSSWDHCLSQATSPDSLLDFDHSLLINALLLLFPRAPDEVQTDQAFCGAPAVSCCLCLQEKVQTALPATHGPFRISPFSSHLFTVPLTQTEFQPDWPVCPIVSPLSLLRASGSLLMLFASPGPFHPVPRLHSTVVASPVFVHRSIPDP